jgi:putative spermidine/putrescine transport system ATP-binding protein
MKSHGRVTPSGDERPASRAAAVRLEGITKRFGGTVAVDGLSLDVTPGEFVCLLGPSGCGKTTTMRIIAGFVEPDAGGVFINGQDVSHRHPNRRDIGMVYQSYALFPHMTVAENVAFGLRMRRIPRDRMTERVARILDLVGLASLGDRKPGQLSGGQQQRVALARAMVIEPTVLLLDEPLSNLDAKLRKRMQVELKTLQRTVGITTIHVTHDQEEALTLADRVAILNHGCVEQVGAPRDVYAKPRNVFVADFLGKANFLPGEIAASEGPDSRVVVRTEVGDLVAEPDGSPWPVRTHGERGGAAGHRPGAHARPDWRWPGGDFGAGAASGCGDPAGGAAVASASGGRDRWPVVTHGSAAWTVAARSL